MDTEPPLSLAAAGRIVLGSLLSALAGWATLEVIALGAYFLLGGHSSGNSFLGFLTVPILAGVYILPVWVVALLPLYLWVPSHSALWRWPVCTLCGAAAGGAIMLAVCAMTAGSLIETLPLVGLAALVGAGTCLFGSLTRGWFRFPKAA